MEIEITEIPPLNPGETSQVDMHSVLNLLNVLHGELTLLGLHLADDPELLRTALARCRQFQNDLHDPAAALRQAEAHPEMQELINREVAQLLERHPDRRDDAEVQESRANIAAVLRVFEVRAQEILARARAPQAWPIASIDELQADFRQVFSTMEKHSRGRFRIMHNIAQQDVTDYYLDFKIESVAAPLIVLPLVFKDVMRDLLANARKYTRPGGSINAGLALTDTELRFSVQDSGCGIPAGEIQTVVHFGKRGSNVGEVRTMGGGFGLTKAFLVTKQFGGRFWIRSALGQGTRIRIVIPRPAGVGPQPASAA